MKLAFYDARAAAGSANGPLFDRLIEFDQAVFCMAGYAARFVHVEFVFDETPLPWPGFLAVQPGDKGGSLCYSSSPRDGGVRFKQIDLTDGKWAQVNLGVLNQADLSLALQFCARRVGLKYDWLAILGFALPFGEHDDDDRFCSESSVELMHYPTVANTLPRRIVDAVGPLRAWRTNPAKLYRAVAGPAPAYRVVARPPAVAGV